ncbi:TraR/DksA C4-type zinc finger protein [Shewanella sp. D64]|uniref:TraR/DksA C4-type zinc finger protein n=1 Tax=unclassified Shewanella TaxID=196818 RepID=UPI0022BA30E1|nr:MULTISPECIES: TraR/DksA C4-type zinc finger protein [unclassified Shewanella]MEC4725661.1 TraR/DksA C4-type zinc finger protein [Shewanella sp. D64]MEC4737732.1 TraR/DksA C4-type zinc finger protein [Shewanella sp. E94]WBJ93535.1 TraR/DksA C4-type zinc finger protein [Shewanella sp. MTB7]
MRRTHIRHELSKLESHLRKETGELAIRNRLLLDNEQASLCDIIEILTQAKLCNKPLFMRLTQLDAAFCQLDIGLYGLCSDCENEIEPERLAKDLLEQRCTSCADKYEHQHRQELRLNH